METLTKTIYNLILNSSYSYFKYAGYFGTQTQVAFEGSPAAAGQLTMMVLKARGFIANKKLTKETKFYSITHFPGWRFKRYNFSAPWPWKFEAILELAGIVVRILITVVTLAIIGGAILAAVVKLFRGI